LTYREQSEIEFGQRRAKFKELYLAREGEGLLYGDDDISSFKFID